MWIQIRLCHKVSQFLTKSVLLMLSDAYLADTVFISSRILESQGPNLTSMFLIASVVQVVFRITPTYGTLVFGPTYKDHLWEGVKVVFRQLSTDDGSPIGVFLPYWRKNKHRLISAWKLFANIWMIEVFIFKGWMYHHWDLGCWFSNARCN